MENWVFHPGNNAEAYLDVDRDGLDSWAEEKAGTDATDPDTDDTGFSDYYKQDSATGLTSPST